MWELCPSHALGGGLRVMQKGSWEGQHRLRRGLCSGKKMNFSCGRNRSTVVGLCRYFVTHPAGTFIYIYSSWLTCHSPSSDVSIQGTIIYRIIGSQTLRGLPWHGTSQPLLDSSRDRSTSPARLSFPSGAAWLRGSTSSASLSPPLPVLSAPCRHPEHTWLTCHSLSGGSRWWRDPPCRCK